MVSKKEKIDRNVLRELDVFARDARFVLGHNILNHDIPRLQHIAPSLQFCNKPRIDTLFLSPLAYPANPYHRLIKNYHIVRDSINDPVQDAMLAGKVFTEQWEALVQQFEANPDVALLYRALLASDADLMGTAEAMAHMGIPLLTGDDVLETFSWFARKQCCVSAVDHLMLQLADGQAPLAPLAYVTAWLSVADGNSVLPPWVRHQFPQVPFILHQLRESNCRHEDCVYCQTHHNPQRFLHDYYGFPMFLILQRWFDSGAVKLPTRLGFTIKPALKSLVLVSKNARISRPKNNVDGLSCIVKNDQLYNLIYKDADNVSPLMMTKIIGQDTLEEVAREIAQQHRPAQFDWSAKFGLSAAVKTSAPVMKPSTRQTTVPVAVDMPSANENPADAEPQKPKQKLICHTCGTSITYNVAKFCWFNKPKFGGNIYCMDCQKKV